jgi:hypothetical protein
MTVEHTGGPIRDTTSFARSETVTYDCTGDWCSIGSFPCEQSFNMRYDEY